MELFRRLLFASLMFVLAAILFSWWRKDQDGYGAINLLKGEKPSSFTPPDKPKLNLNDLSVLGRLNEEFARLSDGATPDDFELAACARMRQVYEPALEASAGKPFVFTICATSFS